MYVTWMVDHTCATHNKQFNLPVFVENSVIIEQFCRKQLAQQVHCVGSAMPHHHHVQYQPEPDKRKV